jgi:hypothetical protein
MTTEQMEAVLALPPLRRVLASLGATWRDRLIATSTIALIPAVFWGLWAATPA